MINKRYEKLAAGAGAVVGIVALGSAIGIPVVGVAIVLAVLGVGLTFTGVLLAANDHQKA
jgi:hypothetical protein